MFYAKMYDLSGNMAERKLRLRFLELCKNLERIQRALARERYVNSALNTREAKYY